MIAGLASSLARCHRSRDRDVAWRGRRRLRRQHTEVHTDRDSCEYLTQAHTACGWAGTSCSSPGRGGDLQAHTVPPCRAVQVKPLPVAPEQSGQAMQGHGSSQSALCKRRPT